MKNQRPVFQLEAFANWGQGRSPRGNAEADVKCNDPIRCAVSSRSSPVEGWKHVCSRYVGGGGVVVVVCGCLCVCQCVPVGRCASVCVVQGR
jgi:hypothetical protein